MLERADTLEDIGLNFTAPKPYSTSLPPGLRLVEVFGRLPPALDHRLKASMNREIVTSILGDFPSNSA